MFTVYFVYRNKQHNNNSEMFKGNVTENLTRKLIICQEMPRFRYFELPVYSRMRCE